jgi:L-fuconolactonase
MIEMESTMEPELPICDAHHHLWERPPSGYMLDDLLQDLRAGHNIVSTVAVECRYGYRRHGVEELKPVGEVEFLESIADRVATDPAITPRVAAAIVGHANLRWGDAVAPVLEGHMAASPRRFRGIRHSTTWDASDTLRSEAPRGLLGDSISPGFCLAGKVGPQL